MKHFIIAALLAIAAFSAAADTNGTIIGATRWTAYYVPVGQSINNAVSRALGPQKWQHRAPFFAVKNSNFDITINGTQATMDAEIAYAKDSELAFWNFLWYGIGNDMNRGWQLYQSSAQKADINWTQMHQLQLLCGSLWSSQYSEIISYFQQSNYQKVLSGRPVWMIYYDGGSAFQSCYGGSWATFKTQLDLFRAAVVAAGVPTPYVVLVYGSAASAKTAGADCVSNYVPDFGGSTPGGKAWSLTDTTIQTYWATLRSGAASQSIDACPIAATGWDTRPRKERPMPWDVNGSVHGRVGSNAFFTLATPAQLTTSLQAMVSSLVSNPSVSSAKVGLIYAWDECDEGGNCIVPTFNAANPAVPNRAILDAVKAVDL